MSERVPANLALEDDGWMALDSASLSVCGEINEIVDSMQSIVDEKAVVSLFKRLGVFSAGFLFHDCLKKRTRFFKEDEPAPTYKTPYLWDDGQRHEEWSDCIHWLFVKVREEQCASRRAGNDWAEDYFVNLPLSEEETRSMPLEQRWRARFGVHYCSVGEMLFTAFAWRVLSLARDLGLGSHSPDDLNLELEHSVESIVACRWRGRSVIQEATDPWDLKPNERAFYGLWGKLLGPQETWHQEWRALLLSCEEATIQRIHRAAVLKFIEKGGFGGPAVPIDTSDDEALNRTMQQRIPAYLARLNAEGKPVQTVVDAIQVLESYARFPILPFYAWNALNQHPICYSVIPIWTSQNHSIKLPVGDCLHLGLALTGLRPIADWDWTLEGIDYTRASQEESLVLTSLLRLMARPLIEGNLYHVLWKEAVVALAEDTSEAIRKDLTQKLDETSRDASGDKVIEIVIKQLKKTIHRVLPASVKKLPKNRGSVGQRAGSGGGAMRSSV